MEAATRCPDLHELKRFAAGDLSDEEARPLEEHLLSCPDCVARMPEVDSKDTFFDALRATPAAIGDGTTATINSRAGEPGRQTVAVQSEDSGEIAPDAKFAFLAPAQSSDELGRLDGYRVLRVVGTGGMGIVFEAEDVRLKRHVALKVMKPELAANAQSQQRFLREAQAMAALDHDHVVTVHQVGEEGGIPFLAMQFLRGESLDSRLKRENSVANGLRAVPSAEEERRQALGVRHQEAADAALLPLPPGEGELKQSAGGGRAYSSPHAPREGNHHAERDAYYGAIANAKSRLPLDEVLRIGREIADGLAAAHERGLIHRDIKPGNIWLETSRGRPRVKILDFGLAHVADADVDLTQSAAILGTPSYMSPEQAHGRAVDARADLFSLGCVLYRMTTGQPPFKGTSPMSVLMSLGTTTPAAPRELNPDIPAELNDLIIELLAKDPAGRPASARAVMDRLVSVGNGAPSGPRAVPPAEEERRQALGVRHQEAADAALLPLPPGEGRGEGGPPSIGLDFADAPGQLDAPPDVENANCKMQIAKCKSEAAAENNPKSKIQNRKSPLPPRRRTFIALAFAAAAAALLAGVVIVIKNKKGETVATVETNDRANVKASPEYSVEVAPSEDDRRPHAPREEEHHAERGAHGGRERNDAETPKTQNLSPKTTPSNPKSKIENPKSPPPLSPMSLVTEPTAINGVKSWTVETISPRGRIYQAEFSPDGTLAATLGIDATLRLWSPATGKLVRALVGASAGQHAFAWSPDGKQIALAENSRVLLWETETGKRLRTFEIERATQVFSAAFSPDARRLAVAMQRGPGERADTVELYALETGELLDSHRTFCGWSPWIEGMNTEPRALVTWSPDGERLAIGNEIWDTAASASRDAGGGVAIAWRGDGALLTVVPVGQGDQGALDLWRIDSNEGRHTLAGEKEAIRFCAFSPGAKYLLAASGNYGEEIRGYVFDTLTGKVANRIELAPDGEGYTHYSLSPDGTRVLAFGPLFGNIWSVAATEVAPADQSREAHDGLGTPSSQTPLWKRPTLLGEANIFVSAWSPDGGSLALRGQNEAISVWDLANARPRVTRYAPGSSLDWPSEDGLLRAWGSEECALYDPATGQRLRSEQFPNHGGWLYASLDGSRVAAVRENQTTIYAADTGQALRTLATPSKYAPAWSLDPTRLITVGEKTTLWDLESGEAVKTVDASAPADWSPNGKRIALVYEDGKRLELRDVESGQQVVDLENDPPLVVPRARLTWSPDGTQLAGLGRVWDAKTGKTQCLLPRFPPSWLARFTLSRDPDPANVDFRARWSPDCAYLAYLAADRSVPVVEAASGRVTTTLLSFAHDRTMSVSASGHFHCSPRFESELVYVVEADAGQDTLSPHEFAEKYGWKNDPSQVGIKQGSGFRAQGSEEEELASVGNALGGVPQTARAPEESGDKSPHSKPLGPLALVQRPAPLPRVESWSLEPVLQAGALNNTEQAVALSRDGTLLAVGGEDGHIRIYEPFTGNTPRLKKLLVGHASRVVSIDWSPDGHRIASAERGQPNVRIWETATGKLVASTFVGLDLRAFGVPLRWSPDNSMLAIGADGDVGGGAVLLDAESGEIIWRLLAPEFGRASSFSWSADGAKLAAACWNRVYIFDAKTGEFERRDMLHPDVAGWFGGEGVAWSPDGHAIAFTAVGHDTVIWKVEDGTIRARLPAQASSQRPALCWLDAGSRLGLNTEVGAVTGAGKWEEWDVDKKERIATPLSTARLAHSSDGRVIAAGGQWGGWIWGMDVIDTRTNKRRTLSFRRSSGCVAWSADGRTLAESGDWPIIWNLDNAPRLECLPRPAANGTEALTWLPEDGSLFDAHGGTDAAIWSRAKQRWQPKMLGIAIGGPAAVSSDGKRLAYVAAATDGKTATVYDLIVGAKLRDVGPHA